MLEKVAVTIHYSEDFLTEKGRLNLLYSGIALETVITKQWASRKWVKCVPVFFLDEEVTEREALACSVIIETEPRADRETMEAIARAFLKILSDKGLKGPLTPIQFVFLLEQESDVS